MVGVLSCHIKRNVVMPNRLNGYPFVFIIKFEVCLLLYPLVRNIYNYLKFGSTYANLRIE